MLTHTGTGTVTHITHSTHTSSLTHPIARPPRYDEHVLKHMRHEAVGLSKTDGANNGARRRVLWAERAPPRHGRIFRGLARAYRTACVILLACPPLHPPHSRAHRAAKVREGGVGKNKAQLSEAARAAIQKQWQEVAAPLTGEAARFPQR